MKKEINTNPDNWEDIELLDANATNEELLKRVNILTEYVNYLYKGYEGI